MRINLWVSGFSCEERPDPGFPVFWMVEVSIMHDCMDAGGRVTHGAVTEEQSSALCGEVFYAQE